MPSSRNSDDPTAGSPLHWRTAIGRLGSLRIGSSTLSDRCRTALDELDRQPFRRTVALGVLAGAALGVLAVEWDLAGLVMATVVATAAMVIALTAQPIWAGDIAAPEPPPGPEDLFDMVQVEGGTFLMGSPPDEPGRFEQELQHEVTVSSFHIGATTVTRAQYAEILGLEDAPGPGGPAHPVTEVSWLDAVAFCNRASEAAGFEPCYDLDGDTVEWRDGDGYRLPTEAEWEYAARAGTRTRWSFGSRESELSRYAWYGANSGGSSHPVATREPNPWGLHDVHGNVWEWCWDVYGEYPREAVEDPRGADGDASAIRVVRGGSFRVGPRWLRSAFRDWFEPELRDGFLGFRCVRGSRPQP